MSSFLTLLDESSYCATERLFAGAMVAQLG